MNGLNSIVSLTKKIFSKKTFEKVSDIGKFIKVDHPKIEGYVNLISGKTLFERMGGKVGKEKI